MLLSERVGVLSDCGMGVFIAGQWIQAIEDLVVALFLPQFLLRFTRVLVVASRTQLI
jgi:hypothetical protein